MNPLQQIAFWLTRNQPVLIHGPSGEGKSYVGRRIKTQGDGTTVPELVTDSDLHLAHPKGVVCISMTPETEESPLYGMVEQREGDGRFIHLEGPITRAYREGLRLVVNEITTSPADVAHLWHPIANGEPIVVKSGGYYELSPAPGFQFIGTTNLEYGGNYHLSAAFYSRFQPVFYPGSTDEELVAEFSERYPSIDPLTITDFVCLKSRMKTAFSAKDAPVVISRRELDRVCMMTEYLQHKGDPDAAALAIAMTIRENINVAASHLLTTFDGEAEQLMTVRYNRTHHAKAA